MNSNHNLFEFDKNQECAFLLGTDEAGRGPLAGPVYAAAVILPAGLVIEGLNDSKKISEKINGILDFISDSLTEKERVAFYKSLSVISDRLESVVNNCGGGR